MSSETNPEPQDAQGYLRRGRAYFKKKEWDKAIADFSKAIELNPQDAEAYANRGVAYGNKKELGNAIADFSKAIDINPRDAKAYFNRGVAYGEKEELDKAIADFDRAAELNPQDAGTYFNRGFAYDHKGEWDSAITDFSKAIKLNPQNAGTYFNRGFAYLRKEEWDNAIADFSKAIRLDPQDADTYMKRGVAYYNKGEWDSAMTDFSKAIKLNPQNAGAYFNRGFAYLRKEEWGNAIADFDRAAELNPQYAGTYFNRGVAYLRKEEWHNALKDFVYTGKKKPSSKFEYTKVYVASIINDVISNENNPKETDKHAVIKIFFQILNITESIQNALFYERDEAHEAKEVAHYTSLDTLKNLVSKEPGKEIERGCFRLYNSAYMNDPEEGRVFLNILKEKMGERAWKYLEEKIYERDDDMPYRSPAYIGSFIPAGTEKQKDSLPLWRMYGKQNGEEAAGSCLIFPEKCFAKRNHPQIGHMKAKSADINLEADSELPIYKIAYADTKIIKKLSKDINALAKYLGKVRGVISNISDDTKGKLKQLVRELLDSVRFLFKASHYEGEREFRVLELDYSEENTEKGPDKIKMDAEQSPPRFYLEAPGGFHFSEVILGPRVRDFENWKWWIKKQSPQTEVKKSDIPYST